MGYFETVEKLNNESLGTYYNEEGNSTCGQYFLTLFEEKAWLRLNYKTNQIDVLLAGSNKFLPVPENIAELVEMVKKAEGDLFEFKTIVHSFLSGDFKYIIPPDMD
jgi:hypothetical protein